MSRLAVLSGALVATLWVGQTAHASECVTGPLPDNPDNQVNLCSPTANELQATILSNGLQLSWDAPPRATSAYVSGVQASRWQSLDTLSTVPTMQLSGAYLGFLDQRIQFDIESIDSSGVSVDHGAVGQNRLHVRWTSVYRTTQNGAVGGLFDLPVGYAGAPLGFEAPTSGPNPDTTVVAGIRVRFQVGDPMHVQDVAFFDVEDFEGWHVWRWGNDASSPNYQSVGEYSKLADTRSPVDAWPNAQPSASRITFLDTNVFDGFVYHYAVTSYDQGFRRSTGGDLALKFESPLHLATNNPDGSTTLGSTQLQVAYRKQPPTTFEPIAAVPNPFRASSVDPARPETQFVYFINAPQKGTLYVWTVAGDLVLQRDQEQPTVGTIQWDTTNESGQLVASGVYIYKIVDLVSGQASFGRLIIIR